MSLPIQVVLMDRDIVRRAVAVDTTTVIVSSGKSVPHDSPPHQHSRAHGLRHRHVSGHGRRQVQGDDQQGGLEQVYAVPASIHREVTHGQRHRGESREGMKERPILFSTEMVRAILDGRKSQTRRIIKKQPVDILPMNVPNEWVALLTREPAHGEVWKCRYGIPGDRLWVRETWFPIPKSEGGGAIYKVTNSDSYKPSLKWKPSIFMPRWASRITLEIVNIRVERVQDISEDDCDAEMFGGDIPDVVMPNFGFHGGMSMQECYARYWDFINAKRGYGWDVNPYVWVIEFKRVK